MLSIDQALKLVLERAAPLSVESVNLNASLDRVLAESVASDIDSPPHDKSMVDGYAIVRDDLSNGAAQLKVLEQVVAGDVPTRRVTSGYATRIMTGAPIPEGADLVVMVEQTRTLQEGTTLPETILIEADADAPRHIMERGTAHREGQKLLAAGVQLGPIEIGLLAEAGHPRPLVYNRPRVAIVSTGDELVPSRQRPSPGQIRNSNGPMLVAAVGSCADPIDLGIAGDDRKTLLLSIQRGLEHHILVLSGGVSAGVMDLVPAVLEELGIEQVFHKIKLKPGKPLWFGIQKGEKTRTLVFGLPGNPVSSLVCFELFVRPALRKMAGFAELTARTIAAELTKDFHQRSDRPTYFPSAIDFSGLMPCVRPIDWKGSADLCSLSQADGWAIFPAEQRVFPAGEVVRFLPFGRA